MAGGSKTSRRDQSSIEFKWVPLDAPPVDLSDIHREEDICTPSDTNKQSSKQSELTSSEILSTSQLVSAIGKVWGLANRPLPVFQPKDNVEHNESFHHNDIAGCYSGWKIRKTSTADFGDFHIDHKCAKHYYDMVNPNIEFIGAFQKTLLSKTDSGLSNTSRLWRYTLFDYSYRSVEPWKAQGLSSSGISFDLGSLYERTKEKWSHDLNYPIPKVQVECKNPGEATSQTTSAGNLSAECSECSTSANKSKDSTSVNSVKSVQSKDKSVTTLHSANSLKVVTDIKKIKEVSSIHSSGHHDLQGLNNCVDKQGENIPESKDMLKREDHVHQGAPTKELCSVLGDKSKYSLPSQKHALAGALSGTFVSLCLHPVDTIKTVIQSGSMAEKSIFQIGRTVVSDRGIIGLYRGIASNIASSAPISAVYTYTYESVKAALLPILPKEYQSIGHCMAGGCASIATSVIFTPSERIKQQMQVCSSCNMRSTCEKAYLVPPKEDEARTIDVMRILLTYGFDPVTGTVENKYLLKLKTVRTVVRKLLHEIVKLSAVPIDPNLSPPVIKKPPPKVKQPPPPPRRRVGRDDIEMKKGDWLCTKCDFMNFAKNTVCLQCDAKRPKRQLLPGEWECPECNFLNYRRNMACFHCDHKRPPDEFMENQKQARQFGPRTTLERVTDMPAGSNSWNFDFEDNESDGADVAAFEYADPPKMAEDSPMDSVARGGNLREFEDDSFETSRIPGSNGRGRYSDLDQRKGPTGFDDFDDEEDDDINNYELEMPNNNSMHGPSRNFSEVEGYSESDDFDVSDHHSRKQRSTNSSPHSKPSRSVEGFSGNEDDEKGFDSDGEPSVYSDWKSSHVGDSRNGVKARGRGDSYRKTAFGSDSELEIGSGSDGDVGRGSRSNKNQRNKWSSNKVGPGRRGHTGSDDGFSFSSESEDEYSHSSRNTFGGNKAGPVKRGDTSRNHGQYESGREEFRPNFRKNDRRNTSGDSDHGRPLRGFQRNMRESRDERYSGGRDSYGKSNFERSSHGSFRNNRESNEDSYSGGRANDRRANMKNSDRNRRGEGRGHRNNGRSGGFSGRSDVGRDLGDDKPRRPRVNVR